MGAQALGCAADDDRDCRSRTYGPYISANLIGPARGSKPQLTFPQDILARPHRHGRDAEPEQQLSVQRQVEVVRERQEMRRQAGEQPREPGRVGAKVGDGAHADDAVRVIAEDVFAIRREFGSLFVAETMEDVRLSAQMDPPS